MFTLFLKRLLALFMPIIIFLNTLSFDFTNFFTEKFSIKIQYDFYSSDAGSAEGAVSLYSEADGVYELYWGDEYGNKLTTNIDDYTITYSYFVKINVENGKGSNYIYSYTLIPYGAETILAYRGSFKCAEAEIPPEKLKENNQALYTFGVLSDVHFGRYYSLFADIAEITFPNALNFLSKLNVDMVGISGDLSNSGEEESFKKYYDIVSEYDFPILSVTGNHDVSDEFSLNNWNTYINSDVYSDKLDGVISLSDNNLDFSYSIPETEDVFIFLNQLAWDYGDVKSSRLLADEQLDWLEAQLKVNKSKNVYLFFHTFTSDLNNDPTRGCGNLINSAGTTYDLVFTVGATDEIRFKSLLSEYKNVFYFSGHSHWAFDMQEFNPELNITDYEGNFATSIHVSSVTSPRRTEDNSDEIDGYQMSRSEGYYIEVFEDEIILYGIDFLSGSFLSYAIYRIEL